MTVPENCKYKAGAAGIHLAAGRRDQPKGEEIKRSVAGRRRELNTILISTF